MSTTDAPLPKGKKTHKHEIKKRNEVITALKTIVKDVEKGKINIKTFGIWSSGARMNMSGSWEYDE
jgi:hypothetical protein